MDAPSPVFLAPIVFWFDLENQHVMLFEYPPLLRVLFLLALLFYVCPVTPSGIEQALLHILWVEII